ncbi:MAG: DoxX family protein [bacterium]|nr:DoxX family protein [bacterium]
MKNSYKFILVLLRLSLGWLMFYAGVTKIADPNWSAAGYLQGAKTFPGFFSWFLEPSILPVINFINEWGLTLLGVSLIFGVCVRLSGVLGAALMMLYYFPVLDFPYPNAHSYIVDEHIIYASVLLLFATVNAGRVFGLDKKLMTMPWADRHSGLRKVLG